MLSETKNDGSNFINWLVSNKGLKERSAKDVYSRYNRASRLIEINPNIDYDDIIYLISKNNDYKLLSNTVKSQIKRAIKFYIEFCSRDNKNN
jgi:hypothetical protein